MAAKAYADENTLSDALANFLENMPDYIEGEKGNRTVLNPVNPEENFADKWETCPEREDYFYEWLAKAKEDFVEIFNLNGFQKSVDNLREVFDEKIVNQALRKSGLENFVEKRSLFRQLNEKLFSSVTYKQTPYWKLDPYNSVNISARYKDKKGWHSLVSKNPLPKDVDIQFTAHTNVEGLINVYWQVINTGEEARRKDNLRGGIFPAGTAGKGGLQHKEYARYTGTHWIECFIIQNNICVAKSGEFIVKIQ